LLAELTRRQIHPRFHIALLRLYSPNNNMFFPNRKKVEPYNFGAPKDAEWYVDEIIGHQWKGQAVEFLVKWNMGDSTWEPLGHCNKLVALDDYLMLMGIEKWQDLPKRLMKTSWSSPHDRACAN
jgi:hypothetical protein